MKRFFLVLTFLTLCLMLCASASADSAPMQLMRMNPLAFSKQPTRIESVTPTPDGSFVIIYFADSDTAGMQEMRLELFDAAGASLLSAALGDANLLEEGAPYPRGQVILEKTASCANITRTLRRWKSTSSASTATRGSRYRSRRRRS